MAKKTGIQWAGMFGPDGEYVKGGSWNIGYGCDIVNPACARCYAMRDTYKLNLKMCGQADRLEREGGSTPEKIAAMRQKYAGLTQIVNDRHVWSGVGVRAMPERLEQWMRKQSGQSWFFCSETDFFHPGYDDEYLVRWYAAFGLCAHHTVYLLTKRAARQAEFTQTMRARVMAAQDDLLREFPQLRHLRKQETWPFPNVWNGVSAGNHKLLVEMAEPLSETASYCPWVSNEPLFGDPQVLSALVPYVERGLQIPKWMIFGGESDDDLAFARPMELEWVREGIRDCRALGIAPFMKQKGTFLANEMGCRDKKGGDIAEWPEDIKVREYPILAGAG